MHAYDFMNLVILIVREEVVEVEEMAILERTVYKYVFTVAGITLFVQYRVEYNKHFQQCQCKNYLYRGPTNWIFFCFWME